MTYFDSIRFQFQHRSAEEKLQILRIESIPLISAIQGYGALIQHALQHPQTTAHTADLPHWSVSVVQSTERLRDLIDALVRPDYRADRGMPELRPYPSLVEAIQHTATRAMLPLALLLDDPAQMVLHSPYPLVIRDTAGQLRQIILWLDASHYVLQLLQLNDQPMLHVAYEMKSRSLLSVARIISRWLAEAWSIQAIEQEDQDTDG